MIILKVVANGLLIVLFLLLSVLIASYFTGRAKRGYVVLLPAETLRIGGKTFTVETLAQQHKPEMYLRPFTPSPKLKWIWYEAVQNESTVDLVYYFTWENEINPNKTIHKLYSVFRAAYYGYPLYDIEYFQLNINKSDGQIQRMRFETSKSDDYFPTVVEHITVEIDNDTNGNYYEEKLNSKGEKLGLKKLIIPLFNNRRVLAGVQTWNHLTRLLDTPASRLYANLQDGHLRFLSDSDYKRYKFVRKSQGDHRTKENKLSFYVAICAIFLFTSIPAYFLRRKNIRSKKI